MRAIDKAKAHYQAKPIRKIEVPEWGDENGPLIIYAHPFTLRDQGKLAQYSNVSNSSESLADLLIMKATDEKGDSLFTIEDKHMLRTQVDASIVARIASEIMRIDVEEIEKNS